MKCPFCGHLESKVTDSRTASEINAIRRRRECLKCSNRFTTFETVDITLQVHKRDGSYEDFLTDKLLRGIAAACRHTRIGHDQVRTLAAEISSEIREKGVSVIEATEIGEIVMRRLQVMDTVAYIRFACVYKRFKDMDDLINAINHVAPEEKIVKG